MIYKFDFPTNTSFNFVHLVNNVKYKLHILYNSYADDYYMNIDRFENGSYKNILNSIKLSLGMNLFLPYKYLGIGDFYIVPTTSNVWKKEPKAESIKDNYFILWRHN